MRAAFAALAALGPLHPARVRASPASRSVALPRGIPPRAPARAPPRALAGGLAAPSAPVAGLPFLGRDLAASLDAALMSDVVGYTLEQLMELAGQAVALAVADFAPSGAVLVAAGPGNNGGDGLVAARHLAGLGRPVAVLQPPPAAARFPRLERLLDAYDVPVVRDPAHAPGAPPAVVVDAVFGFSFRRRGPAGVAGEYARTIEFMNGGAAPVVAVDVPSGWDPDTGDTPGVVSVKAPAAVVSLSAPKLCVRDGHEKGRFAHYVGGRFLPPGLCRRLGFEPIEYEGTALIRRVA